MREQKGYVFHKGKSWFVRYCDDVMQPDGTIKRKLVCKKLDMEYGGEYRTRRSVQPFVDDILKPINAGTLDARSTMSVAEFVEQKYFPQYVATLRPSTRKGYRVMWDTQLKNRRECALALRDFRTIHGQNLLSNIARLAGLSKNYLKHIKSFLSGVFAEAKRLDVLNTVNPMQGTKLPAAPEPEDTHAHGLSEIKAMLAVLEEPAWTVVLCAALSGLRKGEIRGLTWADFDGKQLSVRHSVWNSEVTEPKTARSRAPIPVVKQLAEALEAHKLRAGILAQSGLPIFQAGNGKPLNLDNLVRRVIRPALERCRSVPEAEG